MFVYYSHESIRGTRQIAPLPHFHFAVHATCERRLRKLQRLKANCGQAKAVAHLPSSVPSSTQQRHLRRACRETGSSAKLFDKEVDLPPKKMERDNDKYKSSVNKDILILKKHIRKI